MNGNNANQNASTPTNTSALGNGITVAVIALLTALVTNADRVAVLWEKVFGATQSPPSEIWTHYTTQSIQAFETYINRASPSPDNIAAYSSWPDLHVWHRGARTNTHYIFRSLPWKNEPQASINFFFNDGKIVPIGFAGDSVAYLEVTAPAK